MPALRAWVSGTEPKQYVDDAFLNELGIKYWEIDVNNWQGKLDQICKERDYWTYGHRTNTKESLKHYDKEHLHVQDEMLFLLEGHGYVEVRDKQERWVHVPLLSGILTMFPTGQYHRLILETDVIKRISVRDREKKDPNEPGLPYFYRDDRQTDELPGRKEYLTRLETSDFPSY